MCCKSGGGLSRQNVYGSGGRRLIPCDNISIYNQCCNRKTLVHLRTIFRSFTISRFARRRRSLHFCRLLHFCGNEKDKGRNRGITWYYFLVKIAFVNQPRIVVQFFLDVNSVLSDRLSDLFFMRTESVCMIQPVLNVKSCEVFNLLVHVSDNRLALHAGLPSASVNHTLSFVITLSCRFCIGQDGKMPKVVTKNYVICQYYNYFKRFFELFSYFLIVLAVSLFRSACAGKHLG